MSLVDEIKLPESKPLRGKEKKSLIKRIGVGIAQRLKVLKRLGQIDPMHKHVYVDCVAHGEDGIYYTSKGDFICCVEIEGVSCHGISEANLQANCERIARVMAKLGNKGVPLTIHSAMDTSLEPMDPLPTDWHHPFLREVEEERNRFLKDRLVWKTTNLLFFEWRGSFSLGGAVTWGDGLRAMKAYVQAKMSKDKNAAHRSLYTVLALFQDDKQIMRIFTKDAEAELLRFTTVVDEIVGEITSEANGIGAYEEMDSVIPQVGSRAKVMLKARRLNAEECFKALDMLHDPDPERRKIACLESDYDVADQIGREEVNFNLLMSIATSQTIEIINSEIREIGEHGPYTVGGIARQVFAVRALPLKFPADLFAGLRKAGVPFTVRVRWSPLSDAAASAQLQQYLGRKKHSRRDVDREIAKVVVDRVEQGAADGLGSIGLGSILIAVNGVPMKDSNGNIQSSSRVLLNGIHELKRWASAHQVEIDSLQDPYDQGNGHFSMLPGAWELDPLEMIPIRHTSLGKLLPFYATSPPMAPNKSDPGYPILTLENDGKEIIQRCLEVNEVGMGAICGGTGFGKSYFFNTLILNFFKYQGRRALSDVPRPITVDCFEFGSSSEEGSSFNSMVRLLGGKVIQFGDRAASNVVNPWDVVVRMNPSTGKPLGYPSSYLEMLTQLMVTMAGGHTPDGPVTPEIENQYRNAVTRIGLTSQSDLPGKVRSLKACAATIQDGKARALLLKWLDPKQFGGYFPVAADESHAICVNYNFPLNMEPTIRSVLFGLSMAQIARRAYASGIFAKLILGDEIGAGLKHSEDKKEEAALESARGMLNKLFSNGRRFRARAFLAFQRPSQILEMGNTLISTLRENNSTMFLGEIIEAENAKKLFNLKDGAFQVLRNLEPHQFAMVQEGLLTKVRIVNPPLVHAASTTTPTEVRLRDLITESGRFITLDSQGTLIPDVLAVARAMAECLEIASKPNPETTLEEYIEEYKNPRKGAA